MQKIEFLKIIKDYFYIFLKFAKRYLYLEET